MDTWYVTDLDGTLLDPDGRLRPATVDLLRPLIDRGLKLTVATARTPATVLELLAPLRLTGPAVLMSGALLYDLGQKKPLAVRSFSPAARAALIDFLDEAGRDAFLYCAGDSLTAWHRPLTGSYAQSFRAGRSGTPYKRFVSVEHYHQIPPDPALLALFCLPGPDRPLLTELQAIPDTQCVCLSLIHIFAVVHLPLYGAHGRKAGGAQQIEDHVAVRGQRREVRGDVAPDLIALFRHFRCV